MPQDFTKTKRLYNFYLLNFNITNMVTLRISKPGDVQALEFCVPVDVCKISTA